MTGSPASRSESGVPEGKGASPLAAAFVGREREIAELGAGLEAALSGRGGLFLISGEPGIGKTRLADELAERASERGARVLWGRCWEAGGAPAYWPWLQAIRSYVVGLDAETLRRQLGRGAPALAQVLPDLQEVLPDLPPPPPADPDTARFRLFDAITSLLKSAAGAQPIALVMDDLHAADIPSLLYLRFLAAELAEASLLILATYRETELTPEHPLTAALDALLRQPVTHHLPLVGLKEPDVERYVQLTTGIQPSTSVVSAIHAETEGNPLFLGEVVRLLAAEGGLDAPVDAGSWRVTVPHGVREIIARRLGQLSDECSQLLTLVSVLGHEFDLSALIHVSGLSLDPFLGVLEEATAARVLSEVPGVLGRLRFTHALVRDTLYDALPVTRRLQLHQRMGVALEAYYGEGSDQHLAELAHHFVKAAPLGDVDRAVDYARRAGERAVGVLAYEEGVRLLRTALEALDLKGAVDAETRCDLMLSLGGAQARAGHFSQAKQTFLGVARIAGDEGMPERLARAALGYGGRFLWEAGRDDPRLRRLLEDALAVLGEEASALRARLLARLAAGPLRDDHDRSRRAELSRQAVEMARQLGDPATLAYALEGRYGAVWWPENLEERLAIADELIRVAELARAEERAHQGHIFRCFARLELGDMPAVHEEMDALAHLEKELRQPAQLWLGATSRAALATFQGRFQEAEELISQAFELGRQAAGPMGGVYRTVQLWALRTEQGRLGEVAGDLHRAAQDFPMYPVLKCELTHAYAQLGRDEETRQAFEGLAADDFAALPRTDEWVLGLCLLADAADYLGEMAGAGVLYELLRPFAGRIAVGPPEVCLGSVDRSLALLAARLGRWREADRHFQDALGVNTRAGGRPWVARTKLDWARTLLSRDEAADRQRVMRLLGEAMEISRELSQTALEERAAALLEARPGTGRLRPSQPAIPADVAEFRRQGEYWSIVYGNDAFHLGDLKGLRYLARLLAEPGREFHALELAAAEGGSAPGPAQEPRGRGSRLGDAGEILDPRAKREYRQRLAELEEEIEEARDLGDPERAAQAEEERDFLVQELSRALGLGGRDRRAASAAERARVSVTRALRLALNRILEHSPALGSHLDQTVRTGTFCSYNPDPRIPIRWRL